MIDSPFFKARPAPQARRPAWEIRVVFARCRTPIPMALAFAYHGEQARRVAVPYLAEMIQKHYGGKGVRSISAVRRPDLDREVSKVFEKAGDYVVREPALLRMAGLALPKEKRCKSCGKAPYGMITCQLCRKCGCCPECGHTKSCRARIEAQHASDRIPRRTMD